MLTPAYLYHCDALGYRGSFDQGVADCGKAIELNPAEASAFATRGQLYFMKR